MGFLFFSMMAVGLLFIVGLTLVFTLVRLVFWAVWLPLKIVGSVLLVPLWIARGALKLIFLIIAAPLLLLVGLAAGGGLLVVALAAVIVPLVPILLLAGLIWLVVRVFSAKPATTSVVRSY
jgi:hypothetical protein